MRTEFAPRAQGGGTPSNRPSRDTYSFRRLVLGEKDCRRTLPKWVDCLKEKENAPETCENRGAVPKEVATVSIDVGSWTPLASPLRSGQSAQRASCPIHAPFLERSFAESCGRSLSSREKDRRTPAKCRSSPHRTRIRNPVVEARNEARRLLPSCYQPHAIAPDLRRAGCAENPPGSYVM